MKSILSLYTAQIFNNYKSLKKKQNILYYI